MNLQTKLLKWCWTKCFMQNRDRMCCVRVVICRRSCDCENEINNGEREQPAMNLFTSPYLGSEFDNMLCWYVNDTNPLTP
jgi:hypothetical protein